ncbi:hypothetical protein MKK70_25350 [Methylobacterium sp. E-041]|uniref:hypothetical protein n=1 Tax=Methylobacterium sp. E-041 TaxID=2836573 RepID=UPI001FBACEC8|nr:hypothetical protein [Methylobacterium sp. E-041]MCJ2108639.1 hypothetical protein [Methylobacterium sp. E-041]
MKRDEQIELMQSAEERTKGYLRAWMKDDAVKAAFHRKPRSMTPNCDGQERQRKFG